MRITIKINPKTGVVYLPREMVEDGFKGEVDVFGAGSVLVITHPDADVMAIKKSIILVVKDIELTPHSRSRRSAHLLKSQEIGQNGGDDS